MDLHLDAPFSVDNWDGVADPDPADPDAPPTARGTLMGEGAPSVQWARVVAGSGTGELTGLQGSGVVAHQLLTLDAVLPD